ncbi:MAG: YfcC family protein [Gemmatimonadales bacterium]
MSGPGTSRFPHPLVLLVVGALIAAALTWLVPAGEFARVADAAAGRQVVVPGTWHPVTPNPVGPFAAMVAIPRGLVDAADVVVLVFLVGGAFAVIEATGAMGPLVGALARRLASRELLVIPVCCLLFGLGGVLIQMQEELIAFVPVLLLLVRRLGFDRTTAVAMSLGSAVVGAAFSPIDPFLVGIAQRVAGVPLLSGAGFRIAFLVPALALWTAGTMRSAMRNRREPDQTAGSVEAAGGAGWQQGTVLLLVLAAFAFFVTGVLSWGWGFHEMSATFLLMGVAAGVVSGLGLGGTARALTDGFRSMAYAAVLIGFARSIFVVLGDGRIVDTIVQGLFAPLAGLPVALSALGMLLMHGLLHLPVPSTSGQAVLTMPILAPLADLLGMSRQVAILAYQYGAGLADLVNPTNGALLAMVAAADVPFERWLKFALPLAGLTALLGAAAVLAALALGVS